VKLPQDVEFLEKITVKESVLGIMWRP